MRISDWSSDVCSSDLSTIGHLVQQAVVGSSRLGVENGENIVPQLCNWAAAQGKKSIQIFAEHRLCRRFTQKPPFRRGAKIQNLVSDGDSTSWHVRRFREKDRKSTRLNSSHSCAYRMPSSA